MATSLHSPLWYRVARFKPKLQPHIRVERQIYRSKTWYLLRDSSSGRHHRVNELAYQFVGRMDGNASVEQIWQLLAEDLAERSPTQDEIVQTLIQLAGLELIQPDKNPEFAELFQQRKERERKRWANNVNPLSFKVRLYDPSQHLARFVGIVKPWYSRTGLILWTLLVCTALLAARASWDTIAAHAATDVLTPRFLLLTWLCYPLIKLVHEFAHAYAVKVLGGEVREMGIRVLFLTPVPYVDASAATAFRSKWQRITVSAAGIMAELLLAGFALFIWISVEQSLVKDIAFVTMFIGSVSTVVFNGNPLLRFDGYYVLSDWLDLPNLAQRSNAYWIYLLQRYVLRLRSAPCPAAVPGERLWFLAYGSTALVYRWLVSIWIVLWLSGKSVALASILASWFLFTLAARPLAAGIQFLISAPQLARIRGRAVASSAALLLLATIAIFWVPVPSSTLTQGVVWLPEHARVRANDDGFLRKLLVRDGESVRKGQTLAVLEAPDLAARRNELSARLDGLEAKYQQALGTSPGEATAAEYARDQAQAELERVDERLAGLEIESPADGILVMPNQDDLRDGFAHRGAVLAHLMTNSELQVRIAVAHADAALVRDRHQHVEVQLAEHLNQPVSGKILREVPAATNALPTSALSDRYGGSITTDPQDQDALRTLEPVFLFDISIPTARFERAGGRAWVRIDHGREPLAAQWGRGLRRLVLRHFSVQS